MSDPATAPRAAKAKTFAVVTVIAALIAGIVIGIAADRAWLWHHRGRMAERAMRAITPRILAHLDRELHLTAQQHAAVARILEEHRQKVSAAFARVNPEIRHEIDAANTEIERLLTPEQRTKFEAMKLRMRRSPGRPPGDTPGER